MKKLMMMSVACVACVLFAAPAEKLELLGAAELAPFGEITEASTTFGKMVGNPLMATMMVSGWQQGLVKTYGRFRNDAPVFWLFYADVKAIDGVKDPVKSVLVYPRADGSAQMLLKHTGSTKVADGTIHLLPGRGRPNDTWVKYTADDAFCAFADTSALALRAAKDCEKLIANRKAQVAKGRTPLAVVRLNDKGIATVARLQELANAVKANKAKIKGEGVMKTLEQFKKVQQEQQLAMLRNYRGATIAIDLNDKGLIATAKAKTKAGAKPLPFAGFKLPAGAFDVAQVVSPLFGAGCVGLQGGPATAAEQRLLFDAVASLIGEGAAELKKEKGAQKYAKFIGDVAVAAQEFLRTVPFSGAPDWDACALAFDAAQYPCLVFRSEAKQAAAMQAAVSKLLDRLCAACTRQWTAQKFLVKSAPTSWTLDLEALAKTIAAEDGKPLDAKKQKDLAEVTSTLKKVMGDTKLLVKFSPDGRSGFLGAPNVKPVKAAAKATGEARIAAALPEIAKARPTGAFCLTPYAFVRDTLLPILARFADKQNLAQLQAMQGAMPAPTKNGALAGAVWVERDGSARAVLRVTADEIRNLGAAFNAFTAAQLSAGGDDDDE